MIPTHARTNKHSALDQLMEEARKAEAEAEADGEHKGAPNGAAVELVLVPCSRLRKLPPERLWVVEGLFARKRITLFSALWKSGKTTLLAYLLRALEKGGAFCGLAC